MCEVGFAGDHAFNVMLPTTDSWAKTQDTTEQMNNDLTEPDVPESMECRSNDDKRLYSDLRQAHHRKTRHDRHEEHDRYAN